MREIIFRGNLSCNGKWVEGDLLQYLTMTIIQCREETERTVRYEKHLVEMSTVGQFTGLTDKNGKRIFEGDIVRLDFEDSIGVIEFGDYASPMGSDGNTHHIGFYPKFSGKMEKMLRKDLGFYVYAFSDMAVIGNIHDNPELLKGGGEE